MDQFSTLLRAGLDARAGGRRFATLGHRKQGKRGGRRFATETVTQNPRPIIKPLIIPELDEAEEALRKFAKVSDNWVSDTKRELKSWGWDESDIETFILGIAKQSRKLGKFRTHAEDAKSPIRTAIDNEYDEALHRLNNTFLFGKKPGPRLYEKRRLKKKS